MKTQEIKNHSDLKLLMMQEKDIAGVLEIQNETGLSVWTALDYKIEVNSIDSICMVAKDENPGVVGFAVLKLIVGDVESDSKSTKSSHNSSEIYNIALKDDFQGRGFGQIILTEIISHLKVLQILDIWLEVRKSNSRARGFYQKNGFLEQFVRKNYYQNPVEDAYILKLKINYEDKI